MAKYDSDRSGSENRIAYETQAPDIAKSEQLNLFDEKILSRKAVDEYQLIGQIFDTYWIAVYHDKMILIDQHAAHEKVKYEMLMKRFYDKQPVSQNLMPPLIVTLTGAEAALLEQYQEYFEQLGFEIDSFGGSSYAMRAVPCDLYGHCEAEFLQDILDELGTGQAPNAPTAIAERIATMACKSAVKSFGVKSRFVHFEFFRMTEDQASMGKKGQLVALEVNMRPCGGFTPDMINFARSTNVYKIWADMIAFGGTDMPVGEHYYCPFAGRRDGKNFVYSHEQIMQKYQKNMRMVDRIPEALSGAMGNQMYVATFSTREEMEQFYSDVLAVNDPVNAKVQKELAEVLALGEPTTTALTEKPNFSPAVKPTTAVTKTRSRKK